MCNRSLPGIRDSSRPEVETCDLKGSIPEVFNLFNNLRKDGLPFARVTIKGHAKLYKDMTWASLFFWCQSSHAFPSVHLTIPPCLAAFTVPRLSAGASALALQLCAVG